MGLDTATDIGEALAEIAAAAAAVILPLWRTEMEVSAKADQSPVTEADRRGEALILAGLARRFADVPVISEEHASEFGTPDVIGPRFFLVDPLDGTKAFVRGDPHFTVNIGLIEHGQPTAGAVVAPASGEIWHTTAEGVLKRHSDGPAALIRPRAWPEGAALALISHTMKTETADELPAPRPHHGMGHRRRPRGADLRRRPGDDAGRQAFRLWQGQRGLQERLVRRTGAPGPPRLAGPLAGPAPGSPRSRRRSTPRRSRRTDGPRRRGCRCAGPD